MGNTLLIKLLAILCSLKHIIVLNPKYVIFSKSDKTDKTRRFLLEYDPEITVCPLES